MEIISQNSQRTHQIAADSAHKLLKHGVASGAILIGLTGQLGSGKTTFVQGFARSLGITDRILSPTFTIVRQYPLQNKRFETLYHLDLYRINEPALAGLGIDEIMGDSKNIVLVEWIEKSPELMKRADMHINLVEQNETIRKITIVQNPH